MVFSPEVFRPCRIQLQQLQAIETIGINNPSSVETFFREFIDGELLRLKRVFEFVLIYRYAVRDENNNYVSLNGQPVSPTNSNLSLANLRVRIPTDIQDCINNSWFLLLSQLSVTLPVINAQSYYSMVISDFLRPWLCDLQENNNDQTCIPVFYGEIREKYKYIPQLHLIFELFPKPSNPKDLRKTEMVIPFPKFPFGVNNFNPNVFQNARRTIGNYFAQARWKNFHPTDETTAAFFDSPENAIKFFDDFIFPYCTLTPIESEPNLTNGTTRKITVTDVTNKEKRITSGRAFRVSRLVYLEFDENGFGVDCKEWTVPLPTP